MNYLKFIIYTQSIFITPIVIKSFSYINAKSFNFYLSCIKETFSFNFLFNFHNFPISQTYIFAYI